MREPELYEQAEELLGEFLCPGMYPVICSSGSMALYLALVSLQQTSSSKRRIVAIPELAMIAIPRAVRMAEMEIRTIDCGNDLNLDPFQLSFEDKLFATIAIHTYGRRCNMDDVVSMLQPQSHFIIEDLAEAHGLKPHKETDAACFSFYRNKIIAGEEGGLVAFRKKETADRAKLLRSLGFLPEHDFLHLPGGVNARCSNAHAKLILNNFAQYPENVNRRWEIVAQYESLLPEFARPEGKVIAPWVYDLKLKQPSELDSTVKMLNQAGIAARHCFKPVSRQEEFYREYDFPSCAEKASREVLYLPVDPRMSDGDVKKAATLLKEVTA